MMLQLSVCMARNFGRGTSSVAHSLSLPQSSHSFLAILLDSNMGCFCHVRNAIVFPYPSLSLLSVSSVHIVKYNQMYCINAHYQEHDHLSYKVYCLSISTRLAATMTAIDVRNIVSRPSEQAKSLYIIGSSLETI
jgi:hypothetical protein